LNHELLIDEEAIRFLERQEQEVRKRIFSKLLEAKKDPHHFFKRLEGRPEGTEKPRKILHDKGSA
jgi:hypothetical protein